MFEGREWKRALVLLQGEPNVGLMHVTWMSRWRWTSRLENSRIERRWLYTGTETMAMWVVTSISSNVIWSHNVDMVYRNIDEFIERVIHSLSLLVWMKYILYANTNWRIWGLYRKATINCCKLKWTGVIGLWKFIELILQIMLHFHLSSCFMKT